MNQEDFDKLTNIYITITNIERYFQMEHNSEKGHYHLGKLYQFISTWYGREDEERERLALGQQE